MVEGFDFGSVRKQFDLAALFKWRKDGAWDWATCSCGSCSNEERAEFIPDSRQSAVKYLRGRGQQGEMSFLVLENDVQRFILALKPRSFSESQRIFLMSLILKKMLTFLSERQESMLKGRFSPAGQIEGFTAEIGASGSYCPQHVTLPVQVTYYDISEHSAPSPFLVSLCFWVFTCAWIPLTTP